ncbi:hypothetical protein HGRIS_010634 [Hohenbuehelia grisea]|uniref:NACHT domain-containing protein n=1 Tax=Hohenbuehelia grisea TaxID=104357 RepID=A0ABR3IXE5_9AGAR
MPFGRTPHERARGRVEALAHERPSASIASPSIDHGSPPPTLPTPEQSSHILSYNSGSGTQYNNSGAGQQTNIGRDMINIISYSEEVELFHILRTLEHAENASFDSMRHRTINQCEEGTRCGLLACLDEWVINPYSPERVFWIKGSVGTGKSAIAYTIAKRAAENGQLGGNFFFSRDDHSLHDPRLLFPTIASHLARCNPSFKRAIAAAVVAEHDFAHQNPEAQFRTLVRYTSTAIETFPKPVVFVFDGIDEFESSIGSYQSIMRLFVTELAEISHNIRILVTSRPEPYIDPVVHSVPTGQLRFLDLDDDIDTEADVMEFLRKRLPAIPSTLGTNLHFNPIYPWFSERELCELAWKTGRSFVYATTALRFIADPIVRDPQAQLKALHSRAHANPSSPFFELDQLYTTVLRRACPPTIDKERSNTMRLILAAILAVPEATGGAEQATLDVIAALANCDSRDVHKYLANLQSLIRTTPEGVEFHHSSFPEFLCDETRCVDRRFLLNKPKYHAIFARRCVETLETSGWGPEIVTEALLLQSGSGPARNTDVRGDVHYAVEWAVSHVEQSDPEDKDLVAFLTSFLQSITFSGWLLQSLQCNWVPMGDLRFLCRWNCSFTQPVVAALRRRSYIWEACKGHQWIKTFVRNAELDDKRTGGTFTDHAEGMMLADRCRLSVPNTLCMLHRKRMERMGRSTHIRFEA